MCLLTDRHSQGCGHNEKKILDSGYSGFVTNSIEFY